METGLKIKSNNKEIYCLEGRIFTKDLESGVILEWVPKGKIDQEYLDAIINDNKVTEVIND